MHDSHHHGQNHCQHWFYCSFCYILVEHSNGGSLDRRQQEPPNDSQHNS
jgi:hypothetical protein